MCSAACCSDRRSNDGTGPLRSCLAATRYRSWKTSKMTPAPDAANGSTLWQAVFVSFGVALILFEFIRGWRLGLMRQLVRVCAVIVAYASAIYGGRLLVPILRPFLGMPDFVVAILAGSLLALLIYSVISNLGRIFFKRTAQHVSAPF